MAPKTVLLVDDEQAFLEPLEDALVFEGYQVLKARDVSTALGILNREHIDLVSVDIMLSPGSGLEGVINSQRAGIYLCERLSQDFPRLDAFCISVVSDHATIRQVERCGVQFIGKGETPLRTVISMMKAKLRGVPYTPPTVRRRRY